MTVEERREQMLQMSDREILQTILSYPNPRQLNVKDNRSPVEFPSYDMAVEISNYKRNKFESTNLMSRKQRYAIVSSFCLYSDERLVKPVTLDAPKQAAKPTYFHSMEFRLGLEQVSMKHKEDILKFLNESYPWTDRVNKRFKAKGVDVRALNVSFDHADHRKAMTHDQYKITIELEEPLSGKAAQAFEFYFRGSLKNYIVNDLKKRGLVDSNTLYIYRSSVIGWPDSMGLSKPESAAGTLSDAMKNRPANFTSSLVWWRSEDKPVNSGWVQKIEDGYAYVSPGTRKMSPTQSLMNGTQRIPMDDVYTSSKQNLIKANQFTDAVRDISVPDNSLTNQ